MPATKPVVLAPYDPSWPRTFAALKGIYVAALGELALAIEHVGSTAVPGLVAKPIVDIDIVISTREVFPDVAQRLQRLGYRHNGDQGVPGREAFPRDDAEDVPVDGTGRCWPAHHLYVCAVDAVELRRHLLFRDWLRADVAHAAQYGRLKQRLAELHRDDRDRYCEAKTDFIEAAIREAARG